MSFGPISALGAQFKSSKYSSIPPVATHIWGTNKREVPSRGNLASALILSLIEGFETASRQDVKEQAAKLATGCRLHDGSLLFQKRKFNGFALMRLLPCLSQSNCLEGVGYFI